MSTPELPPDAAAADGAATETRRSDLHGDGGAAAVASPALPVADAAPRAVTLPPALSSPGHGVSPGRATALARIQAAAGQVLPQLQYRVARLGVAGQAGVAALAAAAAVVATALIPAQHALQSLSAELARAQHAPATAEIEQAAPRLIASLPTRTQMPGVVGQIFAQAKAAGVPLDSGRYHYAPAQHGAFDRYELEFPVKADYPAIRTFIDGTLTALPAAALDKLHLERKAIGDHIVSAQVGFIVYVRGERQP